MTDVMERYARKTELKRALEYLTAIKRSWNDFLADREAWYRSGDGRPTSQGGKGYSFPYCFHGSSQWTDYDNICGGCEDSFTGYNPMTFYRWALDKGHQDYMEHKRRSEWFCSAPHDLYRDRDLYSRIIDWCMEPIKREVDYR